MVRYVLRYILYVLAWYTHSNTMFIYCERLKRSTTHLWLDNIHVLLVITRYVIETIVYRSVFVPCTVYRDTPVHRSGLIASSRTVDWVWRATVTFDGARARRRGAACHAPYVTSVSGLSPAGTSGYSWSVASGTTGACRAPSVRRSPAART